MVARVWQATVNAGCFERVVIATDSAQVCGVMESFGAEVRRTGPAVNGTSRAEQVAPPHVAVACVQADLPFLKPPTLRVLVKALERAEVATLMTPLLGEVWDPAVVKVHSQDGVGLNFSRLPVPGPAGRLPYASYYRHVGLYAFQPGVLHRCASMPRSRRAIAEDLEQLTWLDAGIPMVVGCVDDVGPSVDTPAQLAEARAWAARSPGVSRAGRQINAGS